MVAVKRIMDKIYVVLWIILHSSLVKATEYCSPDTFEAQCPSGHLVIMQDATLGRMKLGKCLEKSLGYLGCSTDVLELFDNWCSGQNACSVLVGRNELYNIKSPCWELRRYLEASYTCIPVVNTQTLGCNHYDQHNLPPNTHISSTDIANSGCKKWNIKVNPGQRVEIFATRIGIYNEGNGCETIGYITEVDLGRNKTLCLANKRESKLYSSATGNLNVNIISMTGKYYIYYKVLGCPDLDPDENAVYSRERSVAEYRCRYSKKTWKIKCVGDVWIGVIGNCSSSSGYTDNSFHDKESTYVFPDTILIAIIVGVVLLLSSIIFICALLCIWKQRNSRHTNNKPCMQDPAYGQTLTQNPRGTLRGPGPGNAMTMVADHRFVSQAHDTMKPPQNDCDCYYPTSDASYEFNEGRKYHILERQPPENV